MMAFVLFVNVLSVLTVSSLWTSGALATDLNTTHSNWHCFIQNASTIVKKFEKEVTSDSLLFSDWISLHFRKTTEIHINCKREIRSASLEISLSDVVMKSVRQKLMRTAGGTLCSPLTSRQENIEISYKCCHFDDSPSGITCNVVHPPAYVLWFQILSFLWASACALVALYLPAVICLFPAGPKVSEDNIPCIALGDPSPAGIRMFVAKAFFNPQKMKSCKDKAIHLLLRAALPIVTGLPLFLSAAVITFNIELPASFVIAYKVYAAMLATVYYIETILSVVRPTKRVLSECPVCSFVFSEKIKHSDLREKITVHLSRQLKASIKLCSRFMSWSKKQTSTLKEKFPEWKPPTKLCYIFFSPVILLVVTVVFLMGCTVFLMGCTVSFCLGIIHCLPITAFGAHQQRNLLLRVCRLSAVGWLIINTQLCGLLIPFFFIAVIDHENTVPPRLSLALLVLYYFHTYFKNFSEKYQVLKRKLYEGIQKHQQQPLLLDTTEGDVAIPEKLYEVACQELQMCVRIDVLWALIKIASLSIFVFSFFCSIMIFADRSGHGNLTKIVALFLAAALPNIFSMFSTGDSSQALKSIDIERQLKIVITKYAAGELVKNGRGEQIQNPPQTSDQSTSTEELPLVQI